MFGNLGNIANIGNLLKKIDLKNIDFGKVANMVVPLVPDGKGKEAMDLGLNVAKSGGTPRSLKTALEGFIPGAKEKLTGNQSPALLRQIWANIPDDPDAVEAYGRNILTQLSFLKNKDEEKGGK